MTFTLVQSDIDAYKNDGAVLLKNVISRKWLDRVAGAIERDILDPGPVLRTRGWARQVPWQSPNLTLNSTPIVSRRTCRKSRAIIQYRQGKPLIRSNLR